MRKIIKFLDKLLFSQAASDLFGIFAVLSLITFIVGTFIWSFQWVLSLLGVM